MTQQYFHRYLIVGLRMQTAVTCLIYKKVIFFLMQMQINFSKYMLI